MGGPEPVILDVHVADEDHRLPASGASSALIDLPRTGGAWGLKVGNPVMLNNTTTIPSIEDHPGGGVLKGALWLCDAADPSAFYDATSGHLRRASVRASR